MERIRLTKNEKKTLRGLALGHVYPPDGVSKAAWISALRYLQRIGLVKAYYAEGGKVEDAKLTDDGKNLLEVNPSLHNPIDWSKVSALATIGLLIATIVGIFIACTNVL